MSRKPVTKETHYATIAMLPNMNFPVKCSINVNKVCRCIRTIGSALLIYDIVLYCRISTAGCTCWGNQCSSKRPGGHDARGIEHQRVWFSFGSSARWCYCPYRLSTRWSYWSLFGCTIVGKPVLQSLWGHGSGNRLVYIVNKGKAVGRYDDITDLKWVMLYGPFVKGIHWSPVDSYHRGVSNVEFFVCSVVSLNNLLNKNSNCW